MLTGTRPKANLCGAMAAVNHLAQIYGSTMLKFERKIYSQNGEDGIISHIFDQIGITNKIAVEFGIGDGLETNTRLLAEQEWQCYWLDAEPALHTEPTVIFKQTWITADNIVSEFEHQGIPKEFDLLSIDIDGNDYHVRAALKDYQPRVIIQEYNGCFDPRTEYIMQRNDSYKWTLWEKDFGASLLSLTKLNDDLGYDLVYCESRGVNAFFVRQDLNVFDRLPIQQLWRPLWWASRV